MEFTKFVWDRRVLVLPGPGQGIAGALQRGLARCGAAVVARMDADDVAFPRRLERQLAVLGSDASLAAVGSRVRLFPRRAVAPGMRRYAEWLNRLTTPELVQRDLYVESPIAHPAAAIRREALERAGGCSVVHRLDPVHDAFRVRGRRGVDRDLRIVRRPYECAVVGWRIAVGAFNTRQIRPR